MRIWSTCINIVLRYLFDRTPYVMLCVTIVYHLHRKIASYLVEKYEYVMDHQSNGLTCDSIVHTKYNLNRLNHKIIGVQLFNLSFEIPFRVAGIHMCPTRLYEPIKCYLERWRKKNVRKKENPNVAPQNVEAEWNTKRK